jgi:hypothetical protein
MDLDLNQVHTVNAFTIDGDDLDIHKFENEVFVALGEDASHRLNSEFIEHFKLPHPSGLNRKLNDKQEISRLLYRCKKYIYK